MPQPHEDVSKLIKQMAREAANKMGKGLAAPAEERIGQIPPNYAAMKEIPIDQSLLYSTIKDVIELATSSKREIELDDIDTALKKVECHYLWFC